MADGLMDFLSRETGQRRRQRLEDAITYYIPPELRPLLGLAADANPVVGMERAGQDAQTLFAPDQGVMDRLAAGGRMLSNMAGVAAPVAAGRMVGMPAAQALQEGLLGFSQGAQDVGRSVVERLNQPGPVPTMYSNPVMAPFDAGRGGMGDNGAPRSMSLLDTVDLPAGSRPEYLGAAVDRSGGDFPRYTPKKLPARMARLLSQIDDPNSRVQGIFDEYVNKGRTLQGDDWYNTEELRDWFVSRLGEREGDARWREYINMIGATSAGAPVQTNMRIASIYNALSPEDRARVADAVNRGEGTPAAVIRAMGIDVPNMPPATGPGSYNYGFPYQRLQASNVMNQNAGEWERTIPEGLTGAALTRWLQKNPKVKGFTNDLLGNQRNIAADKHFMRILAMADGGTDFLTQQASYSEDLYNTLRDMVGPQIDDYVKSRKSKGKVIREINIAKAAADGLITDTAPLQQFPTAWVDIPNDPEYAALEEMVNRVAKGYNMTPAQFQANLWMGAGDVTGLADESQGTFMDLFRRVVDNRAKQRGLTRREMVDDFIYRRAPLAVTGAAPVGLLAMQPEEEQY